MKRAEKVIITCAVTGSIHTPSMSAALPITPRQIADEAVAAAEAGAAIVHLHARDPRDGRPTPDVNVFMEFLPEIKRRSDVVINVTTGGALGMSLDDRLQAPRAAKPELVSLNMGSMNFGIFGAAARVESFRYEWERPYLEGTRDIVIKNTFADIETIIRELHEEHGVRFEYECYDVGHLYNLAYFVDRGLLKPPFFIQSILGILGGIGPDVDNLAHMRSVADQLFGDDYYLSVFGAGRHQMPLCTVAGILGGNVRVGLEDSLFLSKGVMANSNAEQVAKIRRILEELSLEVATPDEARAMLKLKGGDNVGF